MRSSSGDPFELGPDAGPHAGRVTGPDAGPDAVEELRARFGINGHRVEAICCLLADGRFRVVEEIVFETATSRRTVEAVLRAAQPHIESSGGAVRLDRRYADEYRVRFRCGQPGRSIADPWQSWESVAAGDRGRLAEMRRLIDAVPRPLQALDQVTATAETVMKRAHFMITSYDLRGAQVLCVGDHDLTSLGVFLASGADGLRVAVVDIDERILEYISTEAARRGFDVRCYAADLRLGLPASLWDSSSLVLTDPPYTPEGVRLFVTRGIQGLRDDCPGRVLLAYGFGELQPALGLAVQESLAPLHMTYEAVLPGFNRYLGAQAIGSAAALYVLRPTRRTKPAARRLRDDAAPGVYTHGAQSVETKHSTLSEDVLSRTLELAAMPAEDTLLVGDDWATGWANSLGSTGSAGSAGSAGRRPSLAASAAGRRLSLADFLRAPLPRSRAGHRGAVVNLYPAFGSSLLRVLLAANLDRVAVLCPPDSTELRHAGGREMLSRLVGPKYAIARVLHDAPAPDMTFVLAEKVRAREVGGAERVTGYIYARPHGKIGSAWREGLIALQRSRGHTLTKAAAREVIGSSTQHPELASHSLLDLPRHLIPVLLRDVECSVEALPDRGAAATV